MLNRFWQKLSQKKDQYLTRAKSSGDSLLAEPITLSRDQHNVSRKKISNSALKVLSRLNNAGYEAYLVGGGVRDILLNLSPKDFDIATNATPEQISKLFKNCRLIGRRFRLAHILFGREVIEVATFRAAHKESKNTNNQRAKVSEQGMLVRDNVYGSIEDDAQRRDFTVNALFYSSKNFTVIDHVGGIEDLQKNQLRLIGEPKSRYTEDPVRMLRAVRLSVKLSLNIEPQTAAPIASMASLLEHVSSARLWDESNKLLLAGFAYKTFHALCKYQLASQLFPQTIKCLSHSKNKDKNKSINKFIDAALINTDKRIANEQAVTPAFLFAVFLWAPLNEQNQINLSRGMTKQDAMHKAAAKVLEKQVQSIAIPKRFSMVMKDIWFMQHRFLNRKRKNVESLLQAPKFRAAYDFMLLRSYSDESLKPLVEWWTKIQAASFEQQLKMINSVNQNKGSSSKGNSAKGRKNNRGNKNNYRRRRNSSNPSKNNAQ